MACILEIDDIVGVQATTGTISGVAGLTTDQTSGVLAALLNSVNQASDVISAKGLGTYGLFFRDLQLTGIVKKGLACSANTALIPTIIDPVTGLQSLADPLPYQTCLDDPSVFTGKNGVNNVNDLLANEALQQELINDVMIQNVASLEAEGLVTGDETSEELSGIAGLAAKFGLDDIKDKLTGVLDLAFGALDVAMDAISTVAVFGALLATIKSMDILGKLTGFGAAIVSLPELASDTIDLADVNAGFDSIVGSARLQSEAVLSSAAGEIAASVPSVPTISIEDLI